VRHEADEAQELHHVDFEHALRDRKGANRIYAFRVCDWLVPTTDLLCDRDEVLAVAKERYRTVC
jgi:hypothetical protein